MKKIGSILTLILASLTTLGVYAKTAKSAKHHGSHQKAESLNLKDYEASMNPNQPVKTIACRSKPQE